MFWAHLSPAVVSFVLGSSISSSGKLCSGLLKMWSHKDSQSLKTNLFYRAREGLLNIQDNFHWGLYKQELRVCIYSLHTTFSTWFDFLLNVFKETYSFDPSGFPCQPNAYMMSHYQSSSNTCFISRSIIKVSCMHQNTSCTYILPSK